MDRTEEFEAERPRLVALAGRVLGDRVEAEDVVQQAWLRLHRAESATEPAIESLPAWLTTVTTRLCLDRLRARTPVPASGPAGPGGADGLDGLDVLDRVGGQGPGGPVADPADEVALADSVGVALQVVLDRLPPRERVAFVLHDSFGFDFATIAGVLDTTPAAARKLASRARARVGQPRVEDHLAAWEVVDAFMAAAKGGDFERLVALLAPDVEVGADEAARLLGTPAALQGAQETATFFNGSAQSALPVYVDDRPALAWFHRGEPRVVFDFEVVDGVVHAITFRAGPDVLATVARRAGAERRT